MNEDGAVAWFGLGRAAKAAKAAKAGGVDE